MVTLSLFISVAKALGINDKNAKTAKIRITLSEKCILLHILRPPANDLFNHLPHSIPHFPYFYAKKRLLSAPHFA
ncbi:MAG: hypothetical protein WC374_01915, partial [Phycisphaerae bacterium]